MVAEAAQQLGGVHILVNSGSAPGGSATATGPIETVVDEDLIEDFNVKYVGALRCSRAVIPFMRNGGLGPHHQHQRWQRPQRRQSQRRSTQCRPGAHDEDAGGAIGSSWDHGQLHPSRHDPHRAHAEFARGPRHPTGRDPRKKRSGRILRRTRRAATPSAAWWTPRRSHSSRYSWPRTRPGRSPANWSRQAEGPGGRCITDGSLLTCINFETRNTAAFQRAVDAELQTATNYVWDTGQIRGWPAPAIEP